MKQEYSPYEICVNAISLFYTKLFWPGARLIRRPFYCRGGKYISYKPGLTVGYGCRFELFNLHHGKNRNSLLEIGENCKFGDRVHISSCESVKIGDNCLLASNILITDNEHGKYKGESQSSPMEIPDKRPISISPVVIGSNVWIGENVVVLPGVHIGDGCVIGANAVVNRDIPSNSIAGGVPAKCLKKWNGKQWIKV